MHTVKIIADVNYWSQTQYEIAGSSGAFSCDELNEKYMCEVSSKRGNHPNTEFNCPYCDGKNKFLWTIRDEKRGDRQGAMRHIVNLSHRYNEYTYKLKEAGIDMTIKRNKREWFELYDEYINVDEYWCEACGEQFDTDAELLAHIKKKAHLCKVIETTQTNHIDFGLRSINVYPKMTDNQRHEISSYETIVKVKFDASREETIKYTKRWVCKCCASHYPNADVKILTFKKYSDICRHITSRQHIKAVNNHSHS
jgi:translation elongation factor EF-1beta